jgi:hypothetical protein
MKPRRPRLCLPFPLPADSKLAHISVFPDFLSAEVFPRESWGRLEAFQPDALLGYAYDLTRLVDTNEGKSVALPTVNRAIYALTDCGMPVIKDALRHKLWNAFGVPIYELIVAPGCLLLAAECELHNGWHLQPSINANVADGEILYQTDRVRDVHSGYVGLIDSTACECGRKIPVLRELRPIVRSGKAQPLPLAIELFASEEVMDSRSDEQGQHHRGQYTADHSNGQRLQHL